MWYLEQFLDVEAFRVEAMPGCFVDEAIEYRTTGVFVTDHRIRRLVLFSLYPEFPFIALWYRKAS